MSLTYTWLFPMRCDADTGRETLDFKIAKSELLLLYFLLLFLFEMNVVVVVICAQIGLLLNSRTLPYKIYTTY